MTPHSVPPSSPPGAEKSKDVEMDDNGPEVQSHVSVPHSIPINGNGDSNGQNNDSDDEVDNTGGDVKQSSKSKVNLEELFDAEDSDEEFSSSAAVRAPNEEDEDGRNGETKGSKESIPAPQSIKSSDPEVLRAYYQRLFPFRYLFQWLNHSPAPSNDFAHREFAFTLQNDAYLRYQSFPSADLLRKQCIQMTPSRFEIGPIYSTNPRDRKTLRRSTTAFRPIGKELVFDIDMTDYDDIRTCCRGAAICRRCWRFITMAIKVVDVALREDFGFRHILWVYSGRRGVHAWVCDRRARTLDDGKRKAIAGYLEVLKGGGGGGARRVNLRRPLHPHISRSLNILKQHFQSDVLTDQDPWSDDSKATHLLDLLLSPSPSTSENHSQTKIIKSLVTALRKKWDSSPGRSSANKWADIDTLAATISENSNNNDNDASTLNPKDLLTTKQSICLEYTYPRLDAEVSKKQIHLLKSPFCIHPGTGRVCVPIDIGSNNNNNDGKTAGTHLMDEKLDTFDPTTVPTVGTLLAEIDAWDAKHGGASNGEANDYENQNQNGTSSPPPPPSHQDKSDNHSTSNHAKIKVSDYEKTSLKPYIDHFRRFVAGLLRDEGFGGSNPSGLETGNGNGRTAKRTRGGNDGNNNNTPMAGGGGGGGDPMEF